MRSGDVVANRFEIEAIGGTGGMGIVYRARDLAAGGVVALKTLAGVGERDAARFAREAAVLAELSHPGIVRYVAHGFTAQHEHYIAMEWLEGETLHDRLQRGRLRVTDAVVMGRAIAGAIAAAHKRDIVHRDLKPMNLFVPGPQDGDLAKIKVLDFGIARHIHNASTLTNTGTVIGTPGYMAPEQVRGETALDSRTDVFALGCVLYRALTGVPPFGGGESLAILAKILVEEVIPPSVIEPSIPPALDAIVLRMLAKDPAERPADGRAISDALASLVDVTEVTSSTPADHVELPETHRDTVRQAITEHEQRLVSVVLSGARPGESSATEPDRLASTAAAFGGRLERIADGANLVLFAHADVATDHATRAARCALALRDVLPGAALVVASGRAAIGRTIVGDVIDRAVSALGDGAGSQIIVDEPTANLLDERFVVSERDGRKYLRGVRDAAGGNEPVRTLLGKATPIVGRDRELATLEGLWAECTEDHVARVVLVTAPPGAGKSRLRQELVRRVLQRDAHAELLIGRGDSLRAGSPFAMVADAVRRAAGVREGDDIEAQRSALRTRVARQVAPADIDRVTHLLGEITGVAFPTEASEALRAARADPQGRGDAMLAAWVDWLAAEAAHHPILLVLEDLHWGDRSTIELVDAALRELAQARFMVVALARPEIHDQHPRLWSARPLQTIQLPQLTKKACDRLVRDLLGTEVTPGTVEQIVDRSAGNAFFLEELIRAVAEGHGDALPDSVLSMLQLRLDALGSDAKRVLRAASVFGEVFWRGGVAVLLGADPREHLELLVDRELISISPDAQLPGETTPGASPPEIEYVFRHDLVREAAFATMGAADRVLAHRLAGEWLVSHGYGDAVALAGHFSLGGEPQRAAAFYARAADQAISGNDSAAVFSHAERGLACNPTGEVAARLRIALAEAHNWRGDHAIAIGIAEEARVGLERGSHAWFRATDEAFYGAGRRGEIPLAMKMVHELTTAVAAPGAALQQVRSVARAAIVMSRFGPPGVGAALMERVDELAAPMTIDAGTEQRIHTLRAMAARSRGDARTCIAEHAAGERACEVTHNLRELAFNCLSFGGCYTELGDAERGVALLRRGLETAERIGASGVIPLLFFQLGLSELELGRFAEAYEHAETAFARCSDNDRAAAGLSSWVMACAAYERGDLERAERDLGTALEQLSKYGQYRSFTIALGVRISLRRNDVVRALELATEAMSLMRPDDGFQEGESMVRLVQIEALEAAGDTVAARAAIEVAVGRLETRAARIEEPWRTSFLGKRVNAATLERRTW
jgi:tetratricopeptide (TPR) repeat protein